MIPVRQLVVLPIRLYRRAVSPLVILLLGPGSGCRFHPTCSQYALEAILSRGVARGLWLSLRRMARCHPWGGSGHDPVPGVARSETDSARP